MTNGEKIKEIFPNTKIITQYDNLFGDRFMVFTLNNEAMQVNLNWWNAEYKETTTQERQADSDKFDAAFQDGYNNGYAQARFDYEQEPTTKNDLGVDCISREQARKAIIDHQYSANFCEEHNIDHSINTGMALIALSDLPSVTPQEPFINKPCVSSGVCEHDKNKVLDKIRAEIDNIEEGISSYYNDRPWLFKDEVLEIIDKYKSESEPQEREE